MSVYACVCAHGSRLRVRDRHTLALAIVFVLAGRWYMRWHCRGAALVSWRCGGAACARCLSANSRLCSTLAQCMLQCDAMLLIRISFVMLLMTHDFVQRWLSACCDALRSWSAFVMLLIRICDAPDDSRVCSTLAHDSRGCSTLAQETSPGSTLCLCAHDCQVRVEG